MRIQEYLNQNPNQVDEVNAIDTIFAPYGLHIDEVVRCAQSIKYIITLPLNVEIQGKIRRAEPNIRYTLSSAISSKEYTYGHEKNYLFIERPTKLIAVPFNSFNPDLFMSKKLTLVLGVDTDGKKLTTDLRKAPHILVGGTTGSGKSELLHSFVCSLISSMPSTNVELLIIDPKRAEFSAYKHCKRIRVITEMSYAAQCLEKAVEIMEERYAEFERNNAKDISSYTGDVDMHPIVIIIDELADLIMTEKSIQPNIERIAQKARACGIHLILGTQSPRRDIVTGIIKANVPTKIALRTTNQLESRIILDRSGAEKLLGKGDMLFIANGSFEPIRIQSAYVSEDVKKEFADSIYIEKQPLEETTSTCSEDNHIEQPTKKKRMGLIKAIFSVKPVLFQTNNYPPTI